MDIGRDPTANKTMAYERRFYIYAYLRTDGTPYYIGRGQRYRMHNIQQHVVGVPPWERRVKLMTDLTHEEANEWEIDLIELLGRIDLGTGCLRNRTAGGNEGNTGWVPTPEYCEEKAKQMREWHRLNPNANGLKISEAKLGHEVTAETRQKIAETLADQEAATAAGFTVKGWVALPDFVRRRIVKQLKAGVEVQVNATLRDIKTAERKGVTVEQWLALTPNQRKHFDRTQKRAEEAGINFWAWIVMTKGERIQAALAA